VIISWHNKYKEKAKADTYPKRDLTLNLQRHQISVDIFDYNSTLQISADSLRKCKCYANAGTKYPPPPSKDIDPLDIFLDCRKGVSNLGGESYNASRKCVERETMGIWTTLWSRTERNEGAKEGGDEESRDSPVAKGFPESPLLESS
jgi:hypothetical protein